MYSGYARVSTEDQHPSLQRPGTSGHAVPSLGLSLGINSPPPWASVLDLEVVCQVLDPQEMAKLTPSDLL